MSHIIKSKANNKKIDYFSFLPNLEYIIMPKCELKYLTIGDCVLGIFLLKKMSRIIPDLVLNIILKVEFIKLKI